MHNVPFYLLVIYVSIGGLLVTFFVERGVSAYRKYLTFAEKPIPTAKTTAAQLANLAFGFMLEKTIYFLRVYRQLDQSERDYVKLPLSPNSYPVFGEKWEYRHCCLWSLGQQLEWLVRTAEIAWKEMGWTDRPMLFADARDRSIAMANLIGSLDDFKLCLKDKISLFTADDNS
jgi:hypothetical protein